MSYDNMSKNPIFRHIKSNNSGMAKVKSIKNERDPPLFTGKLLIKFQNILRNTTQVIIRHRVKILFSGSFSDFQTLNPTSDIINVYSDVFKIQIFFVSGTVIWL
jgi:hypothetical protein